MKTDSSGWPMWTDLNKPALASMNHYRSEWIPDPSHMPLGCGGRTSLVQERCSLRPTRAWRKNLQMKKLTLVIALVAFAGIARAQTWPLRQITLIVPFPPGGSTDV